MNPHIAAKTLWMPGWFAPRAIALAVLAERQSGRPRSHLCMNPCIAPAVPAKTLWRPGWFAPRALLEAEAGLASRAQKT